MTNLLIALAYGTGVAGFVGVLDLVSTDWPWWLAMPQPWLIGIALGTFAIFFRQSPSVHAWLFALAFPIAVACVSMWSILGYSAVYPETWQDAADNWALEWEAWSFGLTCLVLLYASLLTLVVVFKPVHPKDIMAKGMCLMLWSGELYMVFENWLCNIALPTKGSDVLQGKLTGESIYACGRALDSEIIVWAGVVPWILIMMWLVYMHRKARERMR